MTPKSYDSVERLYKYLLCLFTESHDSAVTVQFLITMIFKKEQKYMMWRKDKMCFRRENYNYLKKNSKNRFPDSATSCFAFSDKKKKSYILSHTGTWYI